MVAEKTIFVANGSFGYKFKDRRRHKITKDVNDEKAHNALNGNVFKKLNYLNDNLYEIEAVKPKVDHEDPIIVCFSILQYAELRMLDM